MKRPAHFLFQAPRQPPIKRGQRKSRHPGFGQRLVKEKRLVATIALPSAAGPAVEWIVRAGDGREHPPEQVTLPVSSFPSLETLAARSAS